MKDIKIPIISGLSIAATLALMPMQVLADNAKATVTGGGSDGNLHTPGGGYYSGGYEGAGNGGGSKNHIVTITGDASGIDMSGRSIYGGGMGHPNITPTTSADRNQITVQNRATVTTVIGGEGIGATGNTVNIINATVNRVVLGGNGTWAGKRPQSGDAVGNTVNIEGNSHIIGDNSTMGNFQAIVSGGRARYGHSAENNTVNIKSAAQIDKYRIEGATIHEGGSAKGNGVNITGAIVLSSGQEIDGAVSVSPNFASTLEENYVVINSASAKLQNITGANATREGITIGSNAAASKNYVKLQNGEVQSTTGSYMAAVSNDNYSEISGGKVIGDVHGGFGGGSGTNHVATSTNDYVKISGGEIGGSAYGFRNVNGEIKSSYVEMSGGKVAQDAIGGNSVNGKISNTKVTLNGGEVSHDVIGGNSVNGDVTGARAEIANGATLSHDIIGGRSEKGNAENNWVIADLTGKSVFQVIGGTNKIGSGSGTANNNHVQVTGGTLNGPALGGRGEQGVSGNEFFATETTINNHVSGGTTSSGNAVQNALSLVNSTVNGNKEVKGGNAMGGSASNNSVILQGSTINGVVYGAQATAAGSNDNTVNLTNSTVTGTIYGLFGSGSGSGNTLINDSNAIAPNKAGNIARFDVLNFLHISNANSDANKAALQITDGAQTDINNAKFQLGGTDYNVDTYAIGDGEKRYLIHNENGFTGFNETQTTKRTDNVFTIKNATTYSMNLKGLMKDDDGKSIVIQGKKKTDRTITGAFDNGEITKYSGPAGDPTIDVGEDPNAPQNFGGLDIDTNNVPNAKINLVSGNNIGTIKADGNDEINVGKDGANPLVPGNITAKNIEKSGPGKLKMNFNLPNNYNGGNPAIKLTDNGLTDLTGTDVNVNNAKDGTTYTLVKKTNGGTINFNDRSVQKDQTYTITDKDHYQYDGETFRRENGNQELVYKKGVVPENWSDNDFDSGELTKNQANNDAQAGAHKLFGNKNNTVNVSQSAGDLNGKNISSGRADVKDIETPNTIHDNYTTIKGGTGFGDVYAGYGDSGTQEVHHNELSFEDSSKGAVVNGNVSAGYALNGNVHDNTVTTNDTIVNGNAYGGEAASGNADANTITLNDGKVTGDVKGAKASGSATNNIVNLKGTARVDGNVYAADASSGSGNSVNFHSGSVVGTIYGLSNTGGTNNSLNVYNASTQKTAGDIANLNVLNFNGISNANGSADAAALNLTTAGNTDINNAKFQLNGIDYDPSNDSYGSLNIEEGKEYYLIKNGGDYSNFKEKAKQQTNVFNITDASTYEISLKGMLKSTDNHSIFIQGVKDTKRNISSDKNFDSEEVLKYDPDLTAGTIINVGKAGENKNFNGLKINTVNTDPAKPIKATVTLVEGNNIGTITGDDDDTLKIGKDDGSMTPGSIEAENIAGFKKIDFNLPNNYNGSDPALKLTGSTITDLSQTNVNVNTNNLDDNKDYKLISKDNGTINFQDRSTQKDQVYTITDKDHYQYDGETFRKQNAGKELVYRKGTITDAWIDNGFDSTELTKNQANNDAQAGAHKLFGNKNNTVNVSQSAGDLNGKNISSGRADVKDIETPNTIHDNYTTIKGGTGFGDVYAGYGDSGTQEVHHNELSFEDSSKGAVVNGNVSAGYALNGNVHDNTVTTNDTIVNGNAYGGEAASGNADANTITLNDGKVTGDVKGAKASGSATNNIVNLKGTARVDGNVYAADASSGSGNSVNFHSGSVVGTIYGLSNTGGTNNSLNVYNASTQKTAGDIANLNVLNFNGISNANGSADAAALNLTTAGNTDINNAKFQLNGIDYDPSNDSYGSLNIEEGKEYYLIRNTGNTFTSFTEKAKQTTSEFTLKSSTTYDIMLKGLIKSSDDQSILIQGNKLTSRKISNDGKFDGGEINKYGNILNPVINVVNEDPSNPTDFNGLDIDGGNNSTVNLTGGNNIGDITGGAGSTLNVGKNTTNPAAPNSITAKNIGGFDDINIFMPPTVKDGDSMIKLTDPTANTDLSNMRGKITAYVSGNTDVGDTSTIHLIDKQGSGRLLLPDPSHLQTRVQQGATIDYETYAMVDANGRALDLRFNGKRRVKDDTKSFAETRAASLASLKSGSELITNYLDKLIPDGHLELFPFAISEAYDLRY
ncbi:hypothetical protein, partial [uncultured Campylobacter sp.]|uniref:hypothetical protein n=1 Tax=uncultured Campylobacter sp. TaxID=218934 RepID=UPI0026258DFF